MSHRCCVCSHQTAALFCAKWRQDIKSKLWFVQLMYIYLKNYPARFHPDPIWINGASGCFLKKMPKQQQKHQCNIRSVGTTVFCGTQNFEPSRGICPFPWNFYVFTEFYRTVIRVVTHPSSSRTTAPALITHHCIKIRHILVEFRLPYCMYTWFHHEIHDCHSGSDGRNTENIELSLSEILPVNLVDRLYLSVAVTGDKYRIFGQVQRP